MDRDSVLAVNEVPQKVLVVFFHARKIRDPPPAGVAIRIVLEVEPIAVFGIRVRDGLLKIPAPASHVGKHAVQNHPHPPCVRLRAQRPEIVLRSQHRVNAPIVARVVPVRRKREEDRVQIQKLHAKLLQIGKLFAYAVQIAAVKVVVPDLAVRIRQIHGHIMLVLMHPIGLEFLFAVAAPRLIEPVGENLIHDCALCVLRRGVPFLHAADLPQVARLDIRVVSLLHEPEGLVLRCNEKIVEIKARSFKRKFPAPRLVERIFLRLSKRRAKCLRYAVVLQKPHLGSHRPARDRDIHPQAAVFSRPQRPKRGLELG